MMEVSVNGSKCAELRSMLELAEVEVMKWHDAHMHCSMREW